MKFAPSSALLLASLVGTASAQVQPIATESFEYPVPGLLGNQFGGTGFISAWDVGPNGNEVVMFDPTINPPFAIADGVGGYAGQASGFGVAFRDFDLSPHNDVVDGGGFGRDGAVLWISFSSVAYQVFGDHYGGISLFDAVEEQLFIGSPFGTYAWGIDDLAPNGAGVTTIPATGTANPARIVVRIDHMAGDERVRMWLNPATPYPAGPAAIDQMVPDMRWSRIRLSSGGSGSAYFWDNIVVAKGDSLIGVPFCPGAPNSTGSPGRLEISGTGSVAANDLVLSALNVPPGQFGIFVASKSSATPTPIASGFLCLGGAIGRYNATGQILPAGPSGMIMLPIDLTVMPQPSTVIPALPGDTWYFQAWHRDFTTSPPFTNTSNFTGGVAITLQ